MLDFFFDAYDALKRKILTPSLRSFRQWSEVAPAIRQKSFFSARMNSARALNRYREMLLEWMDNTVQTLPDGRTAYKSGGMSDFVEKGREFLLREGLVTDADLADKSITNPASGQRLQLIFETNILQSNEFATWKSRVSDESFLNDYPAAEFRRTPGARTKRARHVAAEGEIRRWDDFQFWLFQNAADIGGFQVPWPPFGFNSFMRQRPVKRAKAEALGLVRPGERIKPPNTAKYGVTLADQFKGQQNDDFDDITPEIRDQARADLRAQFGDSIFDDKGNVNLAGAQMIAARSAERRRLRRLAKEQA